ncbi:hypothetical protein [Streptomyces sp. NPDC001536]|uniref:hypothetical protein n=1 Tax=Streptomyces sp. NPDC001536 TaxID=3364583 RepID=UPI0036C0A306
MFERTSTTERFARSVIAAVVAVATLVLAANAGPARADGRQTDQVTQVKQVGRG